MSNDISRRAFLRSLGLGSAALAAPSLMSCGGGSSSGQQQDGPIPTDKMTFRENPNTHDRVSLLGYGCMRWPVKKITQDGKEKDTIRRLLQRWLESAGSASGAYKAYDEDITYEDPKDRVRKINNPYK